MKFSEQLILEGGFKELLLSALEKLSKSGIETQAQEAIAKYKTTFLKKRLNMKANYKKSRVKMTKKHSGHAKVFAQEEVDEALEEYEIKLRILAKKATKKRRKGGRGKRKENKGKTVLKQAAQLPTTPVASESGSGNQASNLED